MIQLPLMTSLAMLLYAFGAFAYALFFFFWLCDRYTREQTYAYCMGSTHFVGGVLLSLFALWFMLNLAIVVAEPSRGLGGGLLFAAFLMPPVIMHNVYLSLASKLGSVGAQKRWMAPVYLMYAVAFGSEVAFFGDLVVANPITALFGPYIGHTINGTFLLAVGFMISMSFRTRTRAAREGARAASGRRWFVGLSALLFVLTLTGVFVRGVLDEFLEIVLRSSPLCFLFASQYFHSRHGFFDVLVKRSGFAFIALASLLAYLGVIEAALAVIPESAHGWVRALALLPLVLATPWFYRRFDRLLDRIWIGRRFEKTAALKHFVSGLQNVATEASLVKAAEDRLAEIFGTEGRVRLMASGAETGAAASGGAWAPAVADGFQVGVLELAPRGNEIPFFDEDRSMLTLLAEVFAVFVMNIRLQTARRGQELREHDLKLQATQSELKALRAQINPHFLFNALTAVVGLLHTDPDRAENAVVGLAAVFRYTLLRSEQEWATLEDEMEFVRSYLDVERARFGPKATFETHIDPGLHRISIPAMLIQTLVENAVKHGLKEMGGRGHVGVRALRKSDHLRIQVEDNGEGFPDGVGQQPPEPGKDGGYGMHNVRRRLDAYYGDSASLEVGRDVSRGLTIVSMTLPLEFVPNDYAPAVPETEGSF